MNQHRDNPAPAPINSVPTLSRRRFLKGTAGVAALYLTPIGIDIVEKPRNLIRLASDGNIIVLTENRSS
ncbi:twin-arginine translocation signal domain-containing protein [Halomonas maura]|uniref:twin-arginine translocation signal domain-containing protein n=1 Tax=Halomonas maura TaxID=117606 RepID=UPI0025B2DE0C|nr:twin-arginine translocation signal domain-containing protein [Halomonas maura]MDN3554920.1 twin-arginine translocation signal domain-containing protein [Halomonas maura]